MAYIYIEPPQKTYAKAYRVFNGAYTGDNINPMQINIAQAYPSIEWSSLTSDDFICGYKSDGDNSTGYGQTEGLTGTWRASTKPLEIIPSYDATTGILTVNLSSWISEYHNYPIAGMFASYGYPWKDLNLEIIMIVDGVRSDYVM